MTSSSPTRARWAVAAIFFLHGALAGSWVPHIPLAKERLAVGPGFFGLALLAIAAGAVAAMPVAGALINRYGSARVIAVTGAMFCSTILGPIFAPGLATFLIAGFVLGVSMGSMDVAMNAHGIAVEKALRLPTMSMFHGGFSLGAMAGTFAAAGLMEAIGPTLQPPLVAAACAALLFVAIRFLLPSSADRGLSGSHFAWPARATIGLGALCFLALMTEGSILDWAAIMMRERFTLEASTAALAFGFYQAGMSVSRLAGDWLRLMFGAVPLVAASALTTAAATAVALVAPSPVIATVAFVFAGLGLGNVTPILFAGGGRLEPDAPGRGIAAVTSLGYAGFLAGPPLIGLAAEASSLPVALGLTVIAALVIAAAARGVRSADTY